MWKSCFFAVLSLAFATDAIAQGRIVDLHMAMAQGDIAIESVFGTGGSTGAVSGRHGLPIEAPGDVSDRCVFCVRRCTCATVGVGRIWLLHNCTGATVRISWTATTGDLSGLGRVSACP